MLPLLYNDAGIRVFTIEFDKELTSNSSEPMFNPSVTSFTVVHLAARLKDLEALKLMHSLRKGVINIQTRQQRTALQLCLNDPNMYDVALFLLENCSPNLSLGSISLDDTHPLASKLRETLARSREKPSSVQHTFEDSDDEDEDTIFEPQAKRTKFSHDEQEYDSDFSSGRDDGSE